MEVKNQFIKTKKLLEEYTNYEAPLSYEEWLDVADDLKAGVLFVQFFDQIYLAWNKAKSFYVVDDDGVSEMMKYLMKNVPIIVADKKRFKASYIYRVAYNCLYCVSRDIKRDRDAYEYNTPQYAMSANGDEYDILSTIGRQVDYLAELDVQELWKFLDSLSPKAKNLVENILRKGKVPEKMSEERKEILDILKCNLDSYRWLLDGDDEVDYMQFASVINMDDKVSSAVVIMPDGEKAVYYGEKDKDIEFFGAKKDYHIPFSIARYLRVVDVVTY